MKFVLVTLAVLAVAANANDATPIEKVLQMIGGLQGKIMNEGAAAQKVYDEFAEFCEDRSRNVGFEIKSGKGQVADLQAAIAKEVATSASLTAKIEELSSAISTDEADLAAATDIRKKEKAAFTAEQAELTDVIGTLERAIGILEKEMGKTGSASMLQLQSASSVVQALSVMVTATSLSSADASKLTALIQNSEEDSSDSLGAPAGAVFKGKSGGIIATMQDLFEKAEAQLAEARNSENKSNQAYQMLAQGLRDEVKYATDDMNKAKKGLGASGEAQATAEGDLSVTSKDLAEDIATLSTLHQDCMKGAEDFQAETRSRGEELHALATAKKVITEATSGAADQSYAFLQLASTLSSGVDLANFEAVRFVRDLAHRQDSPALAQLAINMASAMRSSSGTGDPFAKVKSLIGNMIEKLLKDGQADATEHAFCTKEMAETEAKKADKEAAIEKLSTSIDSMNARSAKLKEEVAALQKELAALASTQAEMNSIRAEEKGAYTANSAEMEQGIDGIKMALKVLNEYYAKDKAHASADGAGSGIIGLLEVVESDFTKGLSEMNANEGSAANEYDKLTKANAIEKATKDQSVKYKTKEAKGLDKDTADATGDRATVQEELDAVNEYYTNLKGRCVAKAETYGQRVARRDAEIAGLKEALTILDGEAVLIQKTTKRNLRVRA